MPTNRTRIKPARARQFTPEVFAAFDAGDRYALRRSLKLPPWHASPMDTDLAGPAPYGSEDMLINTTRPAALEIRREILAALKPRRKQ